MTMINDHDDARPRCIGVERAGKRLGISRGTAYKQAHEFLDSGVGLPCFRIGARILVPVEALDALVQQSMPQPPRRTTIGTTPRSGKRALRSM